MPALFRDGEPFRSCVCVCVSRRRRGVSPRRSAAAALFAWQPFAADVTAAAAARDWTASRDARTAAGLRGGAGAALGLVPRSPAWAKTAAAAVPFITLLGSRALDDLSRRYTHFTSSLL